MSDTRAILEESVNRLFTEHVTPQLLRRVESGQWPETLWKAITEFGLTEVFAGGSDDPWRDACVIITACGRHAVPAPLPEHLAATSVLAQCKAKIPDGLLSISPGWWTEGRQTVPWGLKATHLVMGQSGGIMLCDLRELSRTAGPRSLSRDPRGMVPVDPKPQIVKKPRDCPREEQWDGVLVPGGMVRAAQIAGAIERVLALTVQYAKDRIQFGKPIGAYQAIQQQLAVLAGQSAAATRAVDAAFETAARGGDLFFDAAVAKIRAGEAAGLAASIAHQVHGAIGFTDEHVLHYFTRRLWTWRAEFGSESFWARRLGTHALSELGPDQLWPAVTNAR
jgi:acyl-CoA dehydrogenase